MFNLKSILKLGALLLLISAYTSTIAAPYEVTYADTVSTRSTNPPYIANEAFTIKIVLDNGGSNAASQTWTAADVVSVTFSINNAPNTIETVYSPVVLSTSTGNFVTDAAGVLTSVPSRWIDANQGSTIQSTSDAAVYTDLEWYINGRNPVYFDQARGGGPSAYMNNVANNIVPASWSAPTPVAAPAPATVSVPTLSQWSMAILILMLLITGLIKTRRLPININN
jgi:hypothetical protein